MNFLPTLDCLSCLLLIGAILCLCAAWFVWMIRQTENFPPDQ
jgi:hypothetical protein